VDLSGCNFTQAPIISSSLAGSAGIWIATGGSSLYDITTTGFRVYVNYSEAITPSDATFWGWNIDWIASPPIMSSAFCAGTTPTSGWTQYNSDGIYRDVDLSECGFTQPPIISSSLAGNGGHWTAIGGSALYSYSITATGFRVYVYKGGITPSLATALGWNIDWIASPN